MKFFRQKTANSAVNEAWRIGLRAFALRFGAVTLSALVMTAALPPLNWSMAAWFALAPALVVWFRSTPLKAALWGWWWATLYAFAGFYWLREIHPAIPYGIAPVFGAYFIPMAALAPVLFRHFLVPLELQLAGHEKASQAPPPGWRREIPLAISMAALFVLTEYLRSQVLPWNYLSATQWRNHGLMGICAFTGSYGLSFLIVVVNCALAVTVLTALRAGRHYKYAWGMLFAIALLLAAFLLSLTVIRPPGKSVTRGCEIGVIQPAPERRQIGMDTATRARMDREALTDNLALSREILGENPPPALLVWPETSIGVPLRAGSEFGAVYRAALNALLQEKKVPLLLGTMDWESLPEGADREAQMTNTAFLLEPDSAAGGMKISGRYDKNHLVPFGEYVPFRRFLPELITRNIEMGGDLARGASSDPMVLPYGFRGGLLICFEDVFPYLARAQVRRGADFLLVITNDSWYPASAEQEQHLANSVFRAVETGVPMIRCGSNSGSVLIHRDGSFSALNQYDPTVPVRTAGSFSLQVPQEYQPTFFVRFGDWFVGFCALAGFAALVYTGSIWLTKKRRLLQTATGIEEEE